MKIQKQPKYPSIDEYIKKMWDTDTHSPTQEYYSALKKKKKQNQKFAICNNMNGPNEYYVKWNMSEKNKCHTISLLCGRP